MTTLTFTLAQQAMLDGLMALAQDPDEPFMANVTGVAGAGKTSVLSRFLLNKLEEGTKVFAIAPTHAALGQMRLRVGEHPNLTYKTVAAALGQAPLVSNFSNELAFITRGSKPLEGLVWVDESSMLGQQDVERLAKLSHQVIFSGDQAQYAPVKKKRSTEFLTALEHQFNLTEVLRSNDAIASEALKARTKNQYVPQTTECGSITCVADEAALFEQFYKTLENREYEPGDAVWITYTNAEVAEVNRKSHLIVTGRDYLAPGDAVRLSQSCKLGKNNTIVLIDTIEASTFGSIVTTKPQGDGTTYRVEVALPDQYAKVSDLIDQVVSRFNDGSGSEADADFLEVLRAVVPVDYVYAMTGHKSQGASIPCVFANSQRLHGKAAFYVAYSRASQKLYVCPRHGNTKGVRFDVTENTRWYNKKLNVFLDLPADQLEDASSVAQVIKAQFPNNPEIWPSASHLYCVCNPQHSGKSAKGWTLRDL